VGVIGVVMTGLVEVPPQADSSAREDVAARIEIVFFMNFSLIIKT
jgi:hypothetical protein